MIQAARTLQVPLAWQATSWSCSFSGTSRLGLASFRCTAPKRKVALSIARSELGADDAEVFDLAKYEEERRQLDEQAREAMRAKAAAETAALQREAEADEADEARGSQLGINGVVQAGKLSERADDQGQTAAAGGGKETEAAALKGSSDTAESNSADVAGAPAGAWKWEIRKAIWDRLEEEELALPPRPVHHRIPNFKGADEAAEKLATLPEFASAAVVKVNPDSPQKPVRMLTLQAGKKLLTPQPRLRSGFFSVIDPALLPPGKVAEACSPAGVVRFGRPIGIFEQGLKVDVVFVGSVAVDPQTGARLGKGEGFAELEYAILRWMGAIDDATPVITTVRDEQLVSGGIPTEKLLVHDVPVDIIVTPTQIIRVENSPIPKPQGIFWEKLSPQKLSSIKILRQLKAHIEQETGQKLPTGPDEVLPPTAARNRRGATSKQDNATKVTDSKDVKKTKIVRAPKETKQVPMNFSRFKKKIFIWNVPKDASWKEVAAHVREKARVEVQFAQVWNAPDDLLKLARVAVAEDADVAAVVAAVDRSIMGASTLKCDVDNPAKKDLPVKRTDGGLTPGTEDNEGKSPEKTSTKLSDYSTRIFLWNVPHSATWRDLSKHVKELAKVDVLYAHAWRRRADGVKVARVAVAEGADVAAVVAAVDGSKMGNSLVRCGVDKRMADEEETVVNTSVGISVNDHHSKVERQEEGSLVEDSLQSDLSPIAGSKGDDASELKLPQSGACEDEERIEVKKKKRAIFYPKRLFFWSLGSKITREMLREHVATVGNVKVQKVDFIFQNGVYKFCARVALDDDADAEALVSILSRTYLGDRSIKCQVDSSLVASS